MAASIDRQPESARWRCCSARRYNSLPKGLDALCRNQGEVMAIPKNRYVVPVRNARYYRKSTGFRGMSTVSIPKSLELTFAARAIARSVASALVYEGHCSSRQMSSFLNSSTLSYELSALTRSEAKPRADVKTVLHLLMDRPLLMRIAAGADEPRITALLDKR